MLSKTNFTLANEFWSSLEILSIGEKISIPVILETISSIPNARAPNPKNPKIIFIPAMDFCLNDLEIIVYPINRPRNHNKRKDLCINPPKMVIARSKPITSLLNPATFTPDSSITFSEDKAVIIAKSAIGPNG